MCSDVIERTCVDCGRQIEVTVFDDGSYEGGHYFDLKISEGTEYWECDDCYSKPGGERDE